MTSPENPTGGFDFDPLEGMLWGPLRESFGLTLEQWKRLTQVVTLHLALDAYLYMLLLTRLMPPITPGEGLKPFNRLNDYLAGQQFGARLRLAKAAGWIDEDLARDIHEVNALRNKLVHYQNRELVTHAPEIATAEAFQSFLTRGIRAYLGLVKILHPPQ